MDRFERLPPGAAGGTKLCGRQAVNPGLSVREAFDEERFLAGLKARLGEPGPPVADARYSYSVRDRDTGMTFEAYCAQSGPSYGGEVLAGQVAAFERTAEGGFRLRQDAREVLAAFDVWVEAAAGGAG
ncbi:hypothetical protein [Myxococcus sp. AB025B]|uniref:hypothetical protein n=1 Tax=Myxococcus sp. AB025B TaxID=2562794 RepID=UPI001141CB38|nr:hypothetical protein [Myxococcus sp. AB025B]